MYGEVEAHFPALKPQHNNQMQQQRQVAGEVL
jgi:hypothetical protein